MLSSHYLASALRPDHPAHEAVTRPARRRSKKDTLQSRYKDDVAPYLVDGTLPLGAFPETKNALHTKFVTQAIDAQGLHPLLNAPTPDINNTETDLPRLHRSTLSQLRSSHCQKLASYQYRVTPRRADSPICPHCRQSEETVLHIFNCPSVPTDLLVGDLWLRPKRVATFLSQHPSFNLPPLDAPLPRPPPEPPP